MFLSQHIKQTFSQLRSNPLLNTLQVTGSALAIFMIMAYVMMQSVRIEPFAPESHRDRFLQTLSVIMSPKDTTQQWMNCSCLSTRVFHDCFQGLKTPEAAACYTYSPLIYNVGIAQGTETAAGVKHCNDGFWRVFDFTFIDGRPFDEAEGESGIHVAVLNESVARTLFGTTEASGKDIVINQMPFRVVGVVENVSSLAASAYSEVWIPYGICEQGDCAWNNKDEALGRFSVTLLARSRDDFDDIRREFETSLLKFNESWRDWCKIGFNNQPYTQTKYSYLDAWNEEPNMDYVYKLHFIIILCLLLVPAINLSSMTQSRFRQRMIEIGVRRAFGSTRASILNQVFFENLILTLMAGLVGLLLCTVFAYFGGEILFSGGIISFISRDKEVMIDMSMLMHVSTFLYALLFCFILNIMSSCIPAWRISRANIINALKRD